VTLWRRTPREVYRVYGEQEYLAEEPNIPGESEIGRGSDLRSPDVGWKASRLIGLGLLLGVTIGSLALVAWNVSRRASPGSRQRLAPSANGDPLGRASASPRTRSSLRSHATAEQAAWALAPAVLPRPEPERPPRSSLAHPRIELRSTPRATLPAPATHGVVAMTRAGSPELVASPQTDSEFDFERP
jgi:hypothetical protein